MRIYLLKVMAPRFWLFFCGAIDSSVCHWIFNIQSISNIVWILSHTGHFLEMQHCSYQWAGINPGTLDRNYLASNLVPVRPLEQRAAAAAILGARIHELKAAKTIDR